MKKVRNHIIRMLGGLAEQEYTTAYTEGLKDAFIIMKGEAEDLYGKPADEWCKQMYDKIDKSLEQLTKRAERELKGSK